MKKTIKFDKCVICEESREINFEHIPPKSCGNNETRYYQNLLVNIINKKPTKSQLQGGTGTYSICKLCNEKFGREYVRDYHHVYSQAISVLRINTNNLEPIYYKFEIFPLRFLKEICVMFVALNSHKKFPKEIKEFISDKYSNNFPSNIKIYLSYYIRRQPSINTFLERGIVTSNGIGFIEFSEIMFYPFGLLMVMNNNNFEIGMTDITNFSKYNYEEKVKLDFKLNILNYPFFNIDDIIGEKQ